MSLQKKQQRLSSLLYLSSINPRMAVEPFVALVTALIAGTVIGAINSFITLLRSGEAFTGRELAISVFTGVVAALVIVIAQTNALQTALDQSALLIQILSIAITILGVGEVRTAIQASRARAKAKEQ